MVGTGLNWLNIVGLDENTLAMIGSEENVVEDSYHILNWLKDMSILAGSGTEWLEPVDAG
jgi:hypothetical protein